MDKLGFTELGREILHLLRVETPATVEVQLLKDGSVRVKREELS